MVLLDIGLFWVQTVESRNGKVSKVCLVNLVLRQVSDEQRSILDEKKYTYVHNPRRLFVDFQTPTCSLVHPAGHYSHSAKVSMQYSMLHNSTSEQQLHESVRTNRRTQSLLYV